MNLDNADDLDRLLALPLCPADPMLQARLREETTRSLRRQRQLRRFRNAAVLAACYAAGLATVWLLRPAPVTTSLATTIPEITAQETPPASASFTQTAPQLEMLAEQADGAESARLYVAAGKKFVGEFAAWDAALRCYCNALDADPELANAIDPANDDWLMITLKNARKKEREYASASN
jgi:hypothetical protein